VNRPRGLTPAAKLALEILAVAPEQRLGISEFEGRMLQRGTNSAAIKNAVMGLIRRKWLCTSGLMITLATIRRADAGSGTPALAASDSRHYSIQIRPAFDSCAITKIETNEGTIAPSRLHACDATTL